MADMEKGKVEATTPEEAFSEYHQRNHGPQQNGHSVRDTYQPRPSRIGNPGPIGLFSFASTAFILSMYNVKTRNITHGNVVVGMAAFSGGLVQLLAGMWQLPRGNVFAASAFTSYGAFWISYATILIPGFGVSAAYSDPNELASALGIYLIAWMMVSFFFFLGALRKSIAFIVVFAALTLTFAFLAGGEFSGMESVTVAGGAFGIITALSAYYVGISELMADDPHAIFQLPLGTFVYS